MNEPRSPAWRYLLLKAEWQQTRWPMVVDVSDATYKGGSKAVVGDSLERAFEILGKDSWELVGVDGL